MQATKIRRIEDGEIIYVSRQISFVIDNSNHVVRGGYLVPFKELLSSYLKTSDGTSFLITRQWTKQIVPDHTAIGQYWNTSIAGEFLYVVALPSDIYNEEIKLRLKNKLRFGEREVYDFGSPPSADWIGNKWYGKGTYELA